MVPALYLLGEKYIATLQELSTSDNAKTVVLPADLPAALQGMFGYQAWVGNEGGVTDLDRRAIPQGGCHFG